MSTLPKRLLFSIARIATLKKFKNQCKTPRKTQTELLSNILKENAQTEFGQNNHFSSIKTPADYKKQLPINNYEDLQPYINASLNGEKSQLTKEMPILFTVTSGTTGAKKYIPITPKGKKAKSNVMNIWTLKLFKDHPEVLKGRFFIFVSPEIESYSPAGIPCGSQSGSSYKKMPKIVKSLFSVPYEVYGIDDFDTKYYCLLRIAASQSISMIYACNPSSILLLVKRLGDYSQIIIDDIREGKFTLPREIPKSIRKVLTPFMKPDPKRANFLEMAAQKANGQLLPKNIWPDFKVAACWKGGTVGSYIEKFDSYFDDKIVVRDLGYFASEFFGSIPIDNNGSEGVLSIQSNYYEFYPVEEQRDPQGSDLLEAHQLEIGKQYYIYITTQAGLYRYNMNDIIEVTGYYHKTPLIKFVQKRKGIISLVGEKLSEVQMLNAIDTVLSNQQEECEFITSIGIPDAESPHYIILIEFISFISDFSAKQIIHKIDKELMINNTEYASKRASMRLSPPRLRIVEKGEFEKYRKRKIENGNSDGTFKILRISDDINFLNEFSYRTEVEQEINQITPTVIQ